MATLLAPYNQAMQLGTGFNSFTQQLCINNAVMSPLQIRGDEKEQEHKGNSSKDHAEKDVANVPEGTSIPKHQQERRHVPQDVSYKASKIDKVTDVTAEMNINAAFAIKYDAFDAKGKIDFLNTSKVKESDVSFLFSVKVINQVIYDHTLTEIVPIATSSDGQSTLDAKAFTDIYGDCFISGFQEGGTFTAVISVKAKTEKKKRDIEAKADIYFTKPRSEKSQNANGKGNNSFSLNLGLDSFNDSFLRENETTISVTYTGGGQDLKTNDQDWTFDTMKSAALRFPDLVARTPMRTHAVLTKYTSLRSYYPIFGGITPPAFEVAGVYSMLLQEAYLDYKTVSKNLQVLAFEVSASKMKLFTSSEYRQQVEETKKNKAREAARRMKAVEAINKDLPSEGVDSPSSTDSNTPKSNQEDSKPAANTQTKDITKKSEDASVTDPVDTTPNKAAGPYHWQPINITKEYKATLQGLEEARSMVRTFLVRIVQEINILNRHPELALETDRIQPHMSPFIFKELLPVGQPLTPDEEQERELANVTDQIDKVKAQKDDASTL